MKPKTSKPKFLLIGWDAADWKIINPLLDKGWMPNLEKFINEGVISNLATLDPPYSPMLWTSIATGKRPYQHGVLGFHEPWDKGSGIRPVMSTTRKCKAVWNMLMQEGYKSHVVGWWPSHPAEPINGIAISDYFQNTAGKMYEPWPLAEGSVFPKELEAHFAKLRVHPEELTGQHILPFVPGAERVNQEQDKRLSAIANETAKAATLHASFTNIIRTQEWDFAALYLATIDHYCHGFMRYHPPKRPHIKQADYDLFHNVVTAGYRFHDLMLGRLLELAGEETNVMLVSDHGFQPDHLRPRNIPKEPAGPAYEHSPYGIFVMKGPDIKKDEIIYGASLLDVTPTILNCFDLPIGEDMDGKVLTQIFEKTPDVAAIESWENRPGECGMHPADKAEDEDMAARALEQLVELGYIEKPGDNAEKNRKKAHDECQFNLARAYINGGKTAEAIPILEKLYEENPDTARYAFRLATCYQMIGELKKCRQVIEALREKEFYDEATLNVMEGSLLLGERQPIKAIKLFKKAEGKVSAFHARLNLQIARGYTMLQRWKDAERALLQEIELDYDHAAAHELLGMTYLRDGQFEKAADALLRAIGLEYESPNAHFQLGEALTALGEYEQAANAFEVCLMMQPLANMARQRLVELYQTQLGQPDKAADFAEAFDQSILGTITVVSGLPRSGTSMAMQMLEKGGMEIFTDKERQADNSNPRGYYEHEAVKTLARNRKWLGEAVGKAVKVIANLLPHLPPRYRYRVIFMERDLHEVLASQRKMLNRMGKKTKDEVYPLRLIQEYERQLKKTKQWASRQPNVEILFVQHRATIEQPFEQALRINGFLEHELLPELMVQAVDSSLYREKTATKKEEVAETM
ncbi:MAG TPA: tetratricopeptide repeat protein [Bacteroidetes bacterium]|nr:tetratricopeptide repeat protein [Bacteroidota bacterium]